MKSDSDPRAQVKKLVGRSIVVIKTKTRILVSFASKGKEIFRGLNLPRQATPRFRPWLRGKGVNGIGPWQELSTVGEHRWKGLER